MTLVKKWPKLYKQTSTGAIQEWEIAVFEPAPLSEEEWCAKNATDWRIPTTRAAYQRYLDSLPHGEISVRYGQQGGKKVVAKDLITEGKNIGKVHETTPVEQALAEAQSQWEKKQKANGYVESLDAAEAGQVSALVAGGVSPMLAKAFKDHGAKIKFPCYVQPKLDGHRCIAMVIDGKATLWSRTRKRITGVPHIVKALEKLAAALPRGVQTFTLDGELYNHKFSDNFQDLSGYIRSETPKPGHEIVEFWVYDVVIKAPFADRVELLSDFRDLLNIESIHSVRVLETFEAKDKDELDGLFSVFIQEGYEGAMARNRAGLYAEGKRSYDLQKVKEFEDAEFTVVGVREGRGAMAGLAVFDLKNDINDEIFGAKMMGKLSDLKQYVQDPSLAIGRELTVKFFGRFNNGIPRFPVGLRFREDA